MAHYDIFRGQLAIKYPAYGHALWEPSPSRLYSPVEIGDVGFIREGRFHRLFNALLSAEHPSHKFGVPEYHEPLIPKVSDHIIYGTLSPSHYCSTGIDVVAAETDVRAFGPDDYPQASFFCKSKRGGALLSLPVHAQRQDTLAREAFGKWMVSHIDRWFAFARQLELGIEQMEELILVTGCDRARSWTNVAFLKNQSDAQVSFGVDAHGLEGRISWQFSPDRILGAVLNQGPSGKNLLENQCIFIRGFRVARTLGILPKHLRAAAKPPTDGDDNDQDSEPDVELISIPPVSKYQDPLQFIFDYVAKRAPECDMVLVHDDDLAQISGICDINALETLPPDVAENYLQGSNAEIRTDLCYFSPVTNTDRADPQTVRVAKLSMTSYEPNLAPQTFLASESVEPHDLSECFAINTRSLQGDKGSPLDSPGRANMSGHGHSSQSTILHQAAIFSNNILQGPRPISLLHIPPELVTRILLYLTPHDIISCGRTCRMFHDLCSYPRLRYLVQMERYAMSDEMRSSLSYPERLQILENREEAWATLDFRRTVQVSVPFHSTGTYDLTGGAFLLGTRPLCADHLSTVGYSYLSLPSLSEDKKVEWRGFNIGIPILDVGLAVHEHDLIVVLTAKLDVGQPSNKHTTLEMRLSSFSAGQPHPLAEQPVIFIMSMDPLLGHCDVLIEVVGDFLGLLITFPQARDENEDKFFLVRWKRGEAHSMILPELWLIPQSSEWGAYSSFAFLLQDTLVFSDTAQNVLRIAKIVIDNETPRLVPLCVLHLPPLNRHASVVHISCRTEPNPAGSCPSAGSAPSDRPFREKAEDAIIMFAVYIDHHVLDTGRFTFVVHCRALLGHVPAAHRACAPFCSAPEPAPPLVHVPWSAWGPTATRWFLGDPSSMAWITTTTGQRIVTLEDRTPTPIVVRDFNPYAVRATRALAAASGESRQENWSMQLPNGNWKTLKVKDSVLTAGSLFKEDVRSSLPYVETVTQSEYHYDGVMMDDERILGVKSTPEEASGIWSFDVHVLG